VRARLLRSLAFAVGALLAATWLTAMPAGARPLDDVKSSKVLHVILYEDNAPFSWTDADGTVKGADADIARAIAGRLGVKANLIMRYAGEEVDDDLRSNIWQGPRTGGLAGDVMLHVPMEKAFIARNPLVQISNAYYHERIVLAVRRDMAGGVPDAKAALAPFRTAKLAVHFATAAHYYAMFADGGAYKTSINPYRKFKTAAETFLARENAGLLGRRAEIEAAIAGRADGIEIVEPQFDTELRMAWTVGMAVKEDSRDTGYAIGNALRELSDAGEVKAIFARNGLTLVPPPVP
jgi:ABC-type amino acid transport substrate-binding protein